MKILFFLLVIGLVSCQQDKNKTIITNDLHLQEIQTLPTVIKPIPNEILNRTVNLANDLFDKEIESVLHDGSQNRFFDLILDFMPTTRYWRKTTPKVNTVKANGMRRLFTRQANTLISQSPLNIRSQVQLASQSSSDARNIDAASTIALRVSQTLLTKEALAGKQFDFNSLANIQAPNELCPFKANLFCSPNTRFSQVDGSCNNLQQPWMGKAETPYKRYLQPAYGDNLSSPRSRSVTGSELPNPRIVSRALSNENFLTDDTFTHMTAIFGQFLAHDITSAAVSSDSSGRIVDCPCNNGNPSCMSINMPSQDSAMRMSCMRFTRSSAAFSNFDCRLGHREQLNLLTSFIDATQVYGPNAARSRELRSFIGGKLKTSEGFNTKSTLPQGQDGSCRDTTDRVKCFAAGDGRVNENNMLTSLHTLFLREHNRIATELAQVNPTWDDERLFQETRKILIGEMQHIVYNEWLPVIIGWNTAALFDLTPLNGKTYFSGYNPTINPALAGEFATAAFRFGHTLVRGQISRVGRNQQNTSPALNLQDIIFRPVEIYNTGAGGIDSILLGMISDAASKYDPNVVDTLQNHLFEVKFPDGSVSAIDLVAMNVNRGRDHGIPSYNSIREKCGLRKVTSFQDLRDFIPDDRIRILSSVYAHVDDIDLYIAGLSETPAKGALVGPTFACVLANQFKDLKRGDRFYYENGPSNTAFSLDQLAEVKKSSLARILCDNVDAAQVQPNVFIQPKASLNNVPVQCSWLPKVDISKWRE